MRRPILDDADYIEILGERISSLVDLQYYDTAIREAAVNIEVQTKRLLCSEAFGEALIKELYERLDSIVLPSYAKTLRGSVRMAFRLIRNEYAHNIRRISKAECVEILYRLARLKDALDEIVKATTANHRENEA